MKTVLRTIAIVAAFIGLLPTTSFAQTQDNALYVYRNDGDLTAFLREDIDSITLSHYDADSVYQSECVTQVFYTPDSVYCIPIAAIDSVSLVALPTIVNSDVFPLTAEHDPYIMRGDTLSFGFSATTPAVLLPSKGNIVVSAIDCNSFEQGIIARVVSVERQADTIYYKCERAYIDDIYDQIMYHGPMQVQDVNSAKTRSLTIEGNATGLLWNEEYEKVLSKSGTTTTFKASDAVAFNITLRKTLGQPLYARVQLENRFKSSVAFNAEADYENYYQKQLGNTLKVGRISIPNFPLIWFTPTFDFYGYFTDEGKITLDFSAHLNRYDKVLLTYSNGSWNVSHAPVNDAGVDVASLSMKGSAEVGVIAEILLGLYGSRTGIGLSAEVGLKEAIDFEFDAAAYVGSGLYEALKDSYARTTIPWQVSVFAQAGLWDGSSPRLSYTPLKQEPQWGSDKYILPLFSQPEYTAGADGTAVLTTSPSRDLLMPVGLGIGVEDEDGETVETKWNSVEYQKQDEWPLNGESESFSGLAAGTYTAYPYVRILGQELRAESSCEFEIASTTCPDDNHVHAIDLGLPSGTKWACCNVGASSPDGYGGYYAWGEPEEKSDYEWYTYAYSIYDSDGYFTWECTNIGSDIAGTSYDVAHVKWGGSWHMPTLTQIDELISSCTWTWTTQNGVYGQLVTGSNGNSIFLPAAGYRDGASLYRAGSNGIYWGSTALEDDSYVACHLYFGSGVDYWYDYYRSYGRSVRPVSE